VASTPDTTAPQARAPKPKPASRKRVPAEERREQVLAAAAQVVARDGMHAASTAEIARLSGISHAYLFRLFPTKEDLIIAVAVANSRAMHSAMNHAGEAAKARGEEPLMAMAEEYQELLRDRTQLQVMLQSISASASIPALGDRMRAEWEGIVVDIERISGAGPDDARAFLAQGMLLLVISGLGAEESDWATRLHHGPLPCAPGQIGIGTVLTADDPPTSV
jgi:AcrR family transcriptional regulator